MTAGWRSALIVAVLLAAPAGAQEVVESAAPRGPDLTLAGEPLVRIGIVDGPVEYIFGNVTGAVRLADGSIVVADEQSANLRRYDASGRHLWTSGRSGEGPGEYGGLWLVRGCAGVPVTVFDWQQDRSTELDVAGNVLATRSLVPLGAHPFGAPVLFAGRPPRVHALARRHGCELRGGPGRGGRLPVAHRPCVGRG